MSQQPYDNYRRWIELYFGRVQPFVPEFLLISIRFTVSWSSYSGPLVTLTARVRTVSDKIRQGVHLGSRGSQLNAERIYMYRSLNRLFVKRAQRQVYISMAGGLDRSRKTVFTLAAFWILQTRSFSPPAALRAIRSGRFAATPYRVRLHFSMRVAVTPSEEVSATESSLDSIKQASFERQFAELTGFLALSFAAACLLISWEDLTCSLVLPSRHRTSLSLYQPAGHWGASTVQGMGFGVSERQLLSQSDDPLGHVPSYNEVMLRHRAETLPRWKQAPTVKTTQAAIHTVTSSLDMVWKLQDMANDYQWENLRLETHSSPLSDLSIAAAVLRQVDGRSELNQIVGFDWGSCAWRHCGALADLTEALDELDQLLGVLEPYEAVFCLDIVERSLRDIMVAIPWQLALTEDVKFYSEMPIYISKISSEIDGDFEVSTSRIDEAYLEALRELRIE